MGKRRSLRNNYTINPDKWDLQVLCGNKTPYVTKKAALGAASLARVESGDLNIEHFKCKFCHYFHVGHDKNRATNGERITA